MRETWNRRGDSSQSSTHRSEYGSSAGTGKTGSRRRTNARRASFGATLLVNEGSLLRDEVWLAGLDDPSSGTADLDAALRSAPPEATKVALFHSPEVFDRLAPRIDLAFAGHTHGGQVQL